MSENREKIETRLRKVGLENMFRYHGLGLGPYCEWCMDGLTPCAESTVLHYLEEAEKGRANDE